MIIIMLYLGEGGEGGEGGAESREARTDVSLSDSELLATLDDTLTFAATSKQFVVNAVTVRQRFDWTQLPDYFEHISRPLEE